MVTVVLFIGGGVALDKTLDRSPVFTLIGVVVALAGAAYELVELSRVGRTDRAPGPLARQISRLTPRRGRR